VLIGGSVPAAAAALACRVCDDFAQLARLLRQAAEQAPLLPPRCDACGMPFDPPLD
jgi:predicted Zn-ribbon and HTH transcriptional regulator